MKPVLGTCVFCGVCAAVWAAWGNLDAFSQDRKPATTPRSDVITLEGCRIILPKNVRLASDRPGIIAFVEPEEGHLVRAGQQVAGLRDEVARANVEINRKNSESDIEVQFARATYEVDKKEYQKALSANKRNPNTIVDIEVERLGLAQEKSRLQIEKAVLDHNVNGLKLREAEAELKTYQIEAPFNGVVTRVLKQKGEAVRQGDSILEMVNTERVQVEGRLAVKEVFSIKPGTRVVVQLDIKNVELPQEELKFEGRIGFVDVIALPGTDDVRIWADVANHDNILRGGLLAKMTIYPAETAEKTDSGESPRRRTSKPDGSGQN